MSLISHTPEARRGLVNGGLPAKISTARLVLSPERLGGMFNLPLSPGLSCQPCSLLPSFQPDGLFRVDRGTEGGEKLTVSEHLSRTRLCVRHWKQHHEGAEKSKDATR